jgi:hypothetical protein
MKSLWMDLDFIIIINWYRPLALYTINWRTGMHKAMAYRIQSKNGGMTMTLCSREPLSTPAWCPHYTTSLPDLRLLTSYRKVDRFRRTSWRVEIIVFKNDKKWSKMNEHWPVQRKQWLLVRLSSENSSHWSRTKRQRLSEHRDSCLDPCRYT